MPETIDTTWAKLKVWIGHNHHDYADRLCKRIRPILTLAVKKGRTLRRKDKEWGAFIRYVKKIRGAKGYTLRRHVRRLMDRCVFENRVPRVVRK